MSDCALPLTTMKNHKSLDHMKQLLALIAAASVFGFVTPTRSEAAPVRRGVVRAACHAPHGVVRASCRAAPRHVAAVRCGRYARPAPVVARGVYRRPVVAVAPRYPRRSLFGLVIRL